MTDFKIYKARFTPKPLGQDRYADIDTAHLFEEETGHRLGYMISELIGMSGVMELSPDNRMTKIKGYVKPTPTRTESIHFYFAGFKDTEKTGDNRYSCEVEIVLAANSSKIPEWAKETLEAELPPEVEVSAELKYITVREKPGEMPSIEFAEYLTI